MRRLLLALAMAISLLFLVGCEYYQNNPKPKVHLVSLAFQYYGTNKLLGTLNDQKCIYEEFKAMYADAGYEFSATLLNDEDESLNKVTLRNGTETETTINSTAKSNTTVFTNIFPGLFEDEDIGEDDITIFFFSGHGAKNTGSLVGPSISETCSASSIVSYISALPGYKLLIIDACFSGNFFFSEEQDTSVADAYSSLFSDSDPSLTYTWGVYASTSSEESAEFNNKSGSSTLDRLGWKNSHGALTAAILMYMGMDLSTEATVIPDKELTAYKMFTSVSNTLESNSNILGALTSQTPTDSSNFIDLVIYSPDF